MKKLVFFLMTSTMMAFFSGCSGSDGGDGTKGDTAGNTTYKFNGKSPATYYSQFHAEVLNCSEPGKSKWLRKGAVVNSSINTRLNLENGFYLSLDVFLTSKRYKVVATVSEKSTQMPGATETVAVGEFLGLVSLKNGKMILSDGGVLSNGLALNGEDTAVIVLNKEFFSSAAPEFLSMIQPILGRRLILKNIRELLSLAEGNIGCAQGAEALIF